MRDTEHILSRSCRFLIIFNSPKCIKFYKKITEEKVLACVLRAQPTIISHPERCGFFSVFFLNASLSKNYNQKQNVEHLTVRPEGKEKEKVRIIPGLQWVVIQDYRLPHKILEHNRQKR